MATCSTCPAEVIWTRTEKGKPMPVDIEPRPDGNIVLSHRAVGEPPVAVYQSKEAIATLRRQAVARGEELKLYVSHFFTCPDAKRHRKGDR